MATKLKRSLGAYGIIAGLSALLVSNPCNPTGQLVEGEDLRQWCQLARECQPQPAPERDADWYADQQPDHGDHRGLAGHRAR